MLCCLPLAPIFLVRPLLTLPAPPAACVAGNTIRTNLVSTGAFEISYEGVPIWSKVRRAMRGCPSVASAAALAVCLWGCSCGHGMLMRLAAQQSLQACLCKQSRLPEMLHERQ